MLRVALPPCRRALLAPANQRAFLRTPLVSGFAKSFVQSSTSNQNTKPSIKDSAPPVLPGSASKTATLATTSPSGAVTPGAPNVPISVSNNAIPPENVPLIPPSPSSVTPVTSPKYATPPGGPGSTAPTARKKPRRFRTYFLTLVLLTGLTYSGGVWYSLVSDNFHDFFTEYVPFGEDAVLYFEEREFRRRFPRVLNNTRHSRDSGHKITIPSKSGLSWKVTDTGQEGDYGAKRGRHMSAVNDHYPSPPPPPHAASDKTKNETNEQKPSLLKNQAKPRAVEETTQRATLAQQATRPEPQTPASSVARSSPIQAEKAPKKAPEVDEPSVYIPVARIDPLSIRHADEPLVQDLVKIINDIITVVNADNANGMLTSTINKAKSELSGVGQRILDLKVAEQTAAQRKLRTTEEQFDEAARELVRRLEGEMRDQESKWRDEYESERQRIVQACEDRLQAEVARTNQIIDQRSKNQLIEQAIALKREFTSGVKDHVEKERNGRLAKLSELSTSVHELEKLTSEWNSVIDANLQTQHLQVAVEAVRSNLEKANQARPFVRELAALKEIAHDDPVVNSAIASINPIAYQRGVPSAAQIVDRFRRVADEVRKASLLPEDAGIASHVASVVLSKVMFKKQGRAVGDDVESVLTRTETLLEEGNLDDAAREMNSLTGWAKTLSTDWLAEVRRVLEVRQALDVITTEARLKSLTVD